MTHQLKTETFSQKIEHSGGVIVLPLTPLFSFVTFHLKFLIHLSRATKWTRPITDHSEVIVGLYLLTVYM